MKNPTYGSKEEEKVINEGQETPSMVKTGYESREQSAPTAEQAPAEALMGTAPHPAKPDNFEIPDSTNMGFSID